MSCVFVGNGLRAVVLARPDRLLTLTPRLLRLHIESRRPAARNAADSLRACSIVLVIFGDPVIIDDDGGRLSFGQDGRLNDRRNLRSGRKSVLQTATPPRLSCSPHL